MKLRRPLAALVAGAVAVTGLAFAAGAGAAPRIDSSVPESTLDGLAGADATTTGMAVDAAGFVYVGGYDNDGVTLTNARIEVYAPGATGTTAPTRVISGPATDLGDPYRLAVDSTGRLYVGDRADREIVVFAAGAGDNAFPLRTISLFDEGDFKPHALAIGPDGNLYVGHDSLPEISVLPLDADSRAEDELYSFGTDTTDLAHVDAIDFNTDGSEVFVTEDTGYLEAAESRIVVLPNPRASAEVDPVRTIFGPKTRLSQPSGIQVDSTGNSYVVDYGTGEIVVFGPRAAGDVEPHTVLPGDSTGAAGGWNLALGADRSLKVASWDDNVISTFAPFGPYATPTNPGPLKVGAPTGTGSRTVSWTDVSTPDTGAVTYDVVLKRGGIVVHTDDTTTTSVTLPRSALRAGELTVVVTAVAERGTSPAATAPLSIKAVKAAKVGKLKVKGKAKAAKRPVSWSTPAWDGGASITKYRVTVSQGKLVYFKKAVNAPKRSIKLDTRLYGIGKLTVTVQPKTSAGWGAKATKKFTVKL